MAICVIYNPAAQGEKSARFRHQLSQLDGEWSMKPTQSAGDGRAKAALAVQEGFETVVAAGGDGTLNEVLNGIGDVPGGFEKARLAVLPLGTINVFAREIGMPTDFDRARAIITAGKESKLDLPTAEFILEGKKTTRHFLQLAGAGFDARAVETVSWAEKKRFGALAYIMAGLRVMKHQQPQVTVSNGRESFTGEMILLGNGKLYGGNLTVFPQASMQDGLLDASVFARMNIKTMFRVGWDLLTHRFQLTNSVQFLQGSDIALTSNERVPLELDGENVGQLPAQIRVQPQALRVVMP